jgi:uncharacterized membrane protein
MYISSLLDAIGFSVACVIGLYVFSQLNPQWCMSVDSEAPATAMWSFFIAFLIFGATRQVFNSFTLAVHQIALYTHTIDRNKHDSLCPLPQGTSQIKKK